MKQRGTRTFRAGMQAWRQVRAEEGSDTASCCRGNRKHARWWQHKVLRAQHDKSAAALDIASYSQQHDHAGLTAHPQNNIGQTLAINTNCNTFR